MVTGAEPLPARVRLYSRAACHLCDQARSVVAGVCGGLDVGWDEQDIDQDPGLRARFGDYVPVVFVDGRQHDYWRVDPQRLAEALRVR